MRLVRAGPLLERAPDWRGFLSAQWPKDAWEVLRRHERAGRKGKWVGCPRTVSRSDRYGVPGVEVERTAVREAIRFEEARGWVVDSVEEQNRGFDLISRRPHPEDPQTAIEVRFIEVKGRGGIGPVALTAHEHDAAKRLKGDYWLYVVFNCGSQPEMHTVQDPARLEWTAVVKVEHYTVGAAQITGSAQ